jgi:hypothetical protein
MVGMNQVKVQQVLDRVRYQWAARGALRFSVSLTGSFSQVHTAGCDWDFIASETTLVLRTELRQLTKGVWDSVTGFQSPSQPANRNRRATMYRALL